MSGGQINVSNCAILHPNLSDSLYRTLSGGKGSLPESRKTGSLKVVVIAAAVVDSWDCSVRGGAAGCRWFCKIGACRALRVERQITIQTDGHLDIVYVWTVKARLVMWTGYLGFNSW
jgi:hypothetical protein